MHISQFSFSGGQINRGLIGRRDLNKYYSSAFRIENFIVKRHGTLSKRHGFRQAYVFSGDAPARIIPFAKDNQSCDYIVLSTDGTIDVFGEDGARKKHLTGTGYDSETIIHGLEYTQSGDTLFIASRFVPPKRLVRDGDDYALETIVFDSMASDPKPTLQVDTTNWTKADASKTRTIYYRVSEVVGGKELRASTPLAVTVPFPPAEGSYSRLSIQRGGSESDFEGFNIFRNDGSGWGYIGTTVNAEYEEIEEAEGSEEATFSALGPAGSGTYTASATFSNAEKVNRRITRIVLDLHASTSEGTKPTKVVVALTHGAKTVTQNVLYPGEQTVVDTSNWFWEDPFSDGADTVALTLSVADPSQIKNPIKGTVYYNVRNGSVEGTNTFTDDYIQIDYSQTIPVYRQPFSKPGDYPGVVCLFQQRMVWASTLSNPSMFWMSVPGDLNNFSAHTNIQDDDSINAALPLTRGPRILHAVAHKALIMLCENSECVVQAQGDGALSHKTINSQQQSYTGSSERVRPLLCGNAVLFSDRAGASAREYKYDYALDAMSGKDISVLASEMFDETGGIVDWTYQMFPDSVVWCVMADGTLAAFTYMPEQEVYAWSRASLPDGFSAIGIACGDALLESDAETDDLYKVSALSVLAKDASGKASLWVLDPKRFTDVLKDGASAPIESVVEMVVPDEGGKLEPVRKRLVSAYVRGRNLAGTRILSLSREDGVTGADVPTERNRSIEGETATAQLMCDWFRDPRLLVIDAGDRRTELLNASVTFDIATDV